MDSLHGCIEGDRTFSQTRLRRNPASDLAIVVSSAGRRYVDAIRHTSMQKHYMTLWGSEYPIGRQKVPNNVEKRSSRSQAGDLDLFLPV